MARRARRNPVDEHLAWLAGRLPSQAIADEAAARPRLMLENWLAAHRLKLARRRTLARGAYLNRKNDGDSIA